jgi:hypothetical protein
MIFRHYHLSAPKKCGPLPLPCELLGIRDPTQFSEPSIQLFHSTMKSVDVQLQKSHLTTLEHAALQEKIRADQKRKSTPRKSIDHLHE